MKIKKIMKACESHKKNLNGIKWCTDIYRLTLEEIESMEDTIPVVDADCMMIGEVQKHVLKLVRSSPISESLHIALDTVESGVAIIDKEGKLVYMNEAYSQFLGYSMAEALGRNFKELNPKAMVLKALETRKTTYFDKLYVEKSNMFISGRITPLFVDNEFSGVVTSFTDVTAYEQLSKKFEHVNQIALDLQQRIMAQQSLKDLNILGQSDAFMKVVEQALLVAETDVPVLIRGENGAGKEVIAKLIHQNSARRDKPFVVVNCAAIPESLIESELFGYEDGAFTGARAKGKLGKFEMAEGGTLFLDEIGDMPLSMQPKVLRTIQEKEIEKLGTARTTLVDIRIIAATNQPLEEMLERKTFRMDLYYRVNTVSINIPPLRERPDDILVLLHAFQETYNEKYGKQVHFSESVHLLLRRYCWPGNIRELRNFVEHSVIMSHGKNLIETNGLIETMRHTMEEDVKANSPEPLFMSYDGRRLEEILEQAEKRIIEGALEVMNSNRTDTMQALGLSRRTFYRKLNKYGIKKYWQ